MRAERPDRDFTVDFTRDPDGGDSLDLHEVERLLAIGEPSLANLSRVLRHRELWPAGFHWAYFDCDSCAMGLAHALWKETVVQPCTSAMRAAFDITTIADCIFGGMYLRGTYGVTFPGTISPEMVADKIDEYLAAR